MRSDSKRDTGVAYLMWATCLFGFCGIHRIYAKKYVTGVIWFFTGGLLLIGQIIDLFFIQDLVAEANRDILDGDRRAAAFPTPIEPDTHIVLKAIRSQREATLAEIVLDTGKDAETVKRALMELQRDDLVMVDNHPVDGRVIYRIN